MLTRLACLLLFATPTLGQFHCERPLIDRSDSHPMPALSQDGIWTKQSHYGTNHPIFSTDAEGFGTSIEYHRIFWSERDRAYRGLDGDRNVRVLALGGKRIVYEYDDPHDDGPGTRAYLGEWVNGTLHLLNTDTDAGSPFFEHLRSHGLRVNDGVVSGETNAILGALLALPTTKRTLEARFRPPTDEELGVLWNYFEVVRWVDEQNGRLSDVDRALQGQPSLGDLHFAHRMATHARYSDLAGVKRLYQDNFVFGHMGTYEFQRLYERADSAIDRLDQKLELRMKQMSEQIEVLHHREKVVDPDDIFDYVHRPYPGTLLEFHVKAERTDGVVIIDTRAEGMPWTYPLMGDLPEGIQYGLRLVGYDESITVNIPAELAFGPEQGPLKVELEIVQALKDGATRPKLEGILTPRIGPIESERTASGLRYQDARVGEGPACVAGQSVELRTITRSLFEQVLGEWKGTATLGGNELLSGVNEGVVGMQVGGQRILFLAADPAHPKPELRRVPLCVAVELISLGD